jgi:hypothetical protein
MNINWTKISSTAVILATAGSSIFSAIKTVAGDNVALAEMANTVLSNGGAGLIAGIVPAATYLALSNALKRGTYEDLANGIAFISSTAIAITLGGMLYPGNSEIVITTNAVTAMCSLAATLYALSSTEPEKA